MSQLKIENKNKSTAAMVPIGDLKPFDAFVDEDGDYGIVIERLGDRVRALMSVGRHDETCLIDHLITDAVVEVDATLTFDKA